MCFGDSVWGRGLSTWGVPLRPEGHGCLELTTGLLRRPGEGRVGETGSRFLINGDKCDLSRSRRTTKDIKPVRLDLRGLRPDSSVGAQDHHQYVYREVRSRRRLLQMICGIEGLLCTALQILCSGTGKVVRHPLGPPWGNGRSEGRRKKTRGVNPLFHATQKGVTSGLVSRRGRYPERSGKVAAVQRWMVPCKWRGSSQQPEKNVFSFVRLS